MQMPKYVGLPGFLTVLILIVFLTIYLGGEAVIAQTDFDIQGHRGARGLVPENTLPSFETALDLGVRTLEMDLHFTADGVVVVWHDPFISSTKCGLDTNTGTIAPDPDDFSRDDEALLISQLTFEQVQAYRCDRNPEPGRFPDQSNAPTVLANDDYRIVNLAQVFDFVAEYVLSEEKSPEQQDNASIVQFNIETKRDPNQPITINDDFDGVNAGAFELAILEVVEEYDLVDRVIIQSFDHRSLFAIRAENETIRLAGLTFRTLPRFTLFVEHDITIWSPNYLDLSDSLMDRIRNGNEQLADLQVIPWTVNSPAEMQVLIDMGVDGLITDYPELYFTLSD